jgi:hypothetical protein
VYPERLFTKKSRASQTLVVHSNRRNALTDPGIGDAEASCLQAFPTATEGIGNKNHGFLNQVFKIGPVFHEQALPEKTGGPK